MGIVTAATAVDIQQFTGDVEHRQVAGGLVLELEQAALATAVAQRLPLLVGELLQVEALPEPVSHDLSCATGARLGVE